MFQRLIAFLTPIEDLGVMAKTITGCIDSRGHVLDMASRELAKVGDRKRLIPASTPGIWMIPPISASTARMLIGTFISRSRSAIGCAGPGKPTSVSSGSPVNGLAGSWWTSWPRWVVPGL